MKSNPSMIFNTHPRSPLLENPPYSFFGIVTPEEFISAEKLCSVVGIKSKNYRIKETLWAKCRINKKDCFLAISPIIENIYLKTLYQCGAVCGTYNKEAAGSIHADHFGKHVNQNAAVVIGGRAFTVRLIKHCDHSPEWLNLSHLIRQTQNPSLVSDLDKPFFTQNLFIHQDSPSQSTTERIVVDGMEATVHRNSELSGWRPFLISVQHSRGVSSC